MSELHGGGNDQGFCLPNVSRHYVEKASSDDSNFNFPDIIPDCCSVGDLANHISEVIVEQTQCSSDDYGDNHTKHSAVGAMDSIDGKYVLWKNGLKYSTGDSNQFNICLYNIKKKFLSKDKRDWKSESDVRVSSRNLYYYRSYAQSCFCLSQHLQFFNFYHCSNRDKTLLNDSSIKYGENFRSENVNEFIHQDRNNAEFNWRKMSTSDFFQETQNIASSTELSCDPLPLKPKMQSDQIDPELYSSESDNEFGKFEAFPPEELGQNDYHKEELEHEIYEIDPSRYDFAEFSSFNVPLQQSSINGSLPKDSLAKNLLLYADTALATAFTVDPMSSIHEFTGDNCGLSSVPGLFWKDATDDSILKTWQHVTNNSKSSVFQYAWENSFAYAMYLQTIGVDLRNSCRIFAFTGRLKLLEPVPLTPIPLSPIASTKSSDPGNLSTSSSFLPEPSTNHPLSHITPIPEFDWPSSGLTNPFATDNYNKRKEKPASNLDLEYCEKISSKFANKQAASISDLEAEFLKPDTLTQVPPTLPQLLPNALQLGQQHTEVFEKKPRSDCVANVLSQLPDFSYMQKSTFAFPFVS